MNFASIIKRLRSLSWPQRPRNANLRLGIRGERAAASYLKRHRHRIVARNYRCPAGEIDLICRDGETIVFVEVKTRSGDAPIDPREVVRPDKWRRVERTARYYLTRRSGPNPPIRFDLVSVHWPEGGTPRIEHFEDAYCPRYG